MIALRFDEMPAANSYPSADGRRFKSVPRYEITARSEEIQSGFFYGLISGWWAKMIALWFDETLASDSYPSADGRRFKSV
jgi:hypothetical protein